MAFGMQLALVRTTVLLLSLRSSGEMPLMPKIEYCVSFWAKNITCYWDLLPETHSPITYTLHITEESGRCRQDFGRPGWCIARWGECSCGVPVENLFAFYKIQLTAESRGVQVRSLEKCIHGMAVVKLSPPMVNAILANQSCCFQLEWSLPGDEVVSVSEAQYEIQYRDVAERSWAQVNFTAAENGQAFANVCGVFPFTNYSVRVRAKYLLSHSLQGDGDPFWSNWSPERYVRTLPAVPSRGPALWRKFGISGADGKRDVILMWKPLKPKEANGEILTYTLFSQRKGESAGPQCLTRELQCTLRLLMGAGYTFSITARNIAGVSPVTSLIVLPFDGQEELSSTFPVLASPATDHSLLLRWSLPHFPAIRYVFEWSRLPRKKGEDIFWHYHSGNTNHVVIAALQIQLSFSAEAIMPGNLYSLKVFVLIHGNVWASGSTSAYSKQTAPLRAPTLYPSQIWKTQVALQWEMLPLEEQGGVIRNYTLCYKEEGENEQAVVLDSSVQRYVMKGLAPASIVRVYLTVATEGGNTRGSVLSIRTKSDEYGKTEVLILAFSVGILLLLLLFGSLACVSKYQRLQKYLWPKVPDPGKSNIATWMPPKMCLDFPSPCTKKWRQDYLHLTISDILRVHPSQEGETDSKMFAEKQWMVEVPGTFWKISPMPGSEDPSLRDGDLPQKGLSTGNEVDYSKVIVVQKSHNPEQRSPFDSQTLSKYQDPRDSHPGSEFGHGLWLQNLTYETLMDGGLDKRTLEPKGEFPLLISLVALEDLYPAGSPHKVPVEKS